MACAAIDTSMCSLFSRLCSGSRDCSALAAPPLARRGSSLGSRLCSARVALLYVWSGSARNFQLSLTRHCHSAPALGLATAQLGLATLGARGLLALLSSAQLRSASARHSTAICLATAISASPLPYQFGFDVAATSLVLGGGTQTEHISFAGITHDRKAS